MLFCSAQFLLFFLMVFPAYWLLPWQRARVWLLLAASFTFYASWNHWLALLIGVTTTLDYLVARGMMLLPPGRRRLALLVFSLTVNLAVLVYFKYANFFLHSLEEALRAVGGSSSLPVLQVILPIGISFYTFEAINYTVDVYRCRIRPETNLANFMLFITFFPHLVAGPIVRARDFLPRIGRRIPWDWDRLHLGTQFFLLGLFKKLAIADRMALFADPVFADPENYRSSAVLFGVIAYTIQIYCDFSGYTDMAVGIAHMFGYRLAQNFHMPYLAVNVSEFWRRWHISLSSWLRDYLFIPLGGSRGPRWRTHANLLVTMVLGGLWHGASWTFVFWGLLHGLLLIGHRLFKDFCDRRPQWDNFFGSLAGTALRWAITLMCVMVCWVFFRAPSLEIAVHVLKPLVVRQGGAALPMSEGSMVLTLLLLIAGHVLALRGTWKWLLERLPAPALGLAYAMAFNFALILAPATGKAFIYFQF